MATRNKIGRLTERIEAVVERRRGLALSNLMHGLPTPEKIGKANSAMDAWIK
jgi:hypothetical protein